jgi:hypothetical protein
VGTPDVSVGTDEPLGEVDMQRLFRGPWWRIGQRRGARKGRIRTTGEVVVVV